MWAKIFRTEAVHTLFADDFVSPWLFDIELYLRLRKLCPDGELTGRVREHPLTQWRAVGQSSLRLRDWLGAPWHLIRIHRRYR